MIPCPASRGAAPSGKAAATTAGSSRQILAEAQGGGGGGRFGDERHCFPTRSLPCSWVCKKLEKHNFVQRWGQADGDRAGPVRASVPAG